MKRGRKPNSGLKSSIDAHKTSDTDIHSKLRQGYRERIQRLRQLIEIERKTQVTEHKEMLRSEREAEVKRFDAMQPEELYRRQHEDTLKGLEHAVKQVDEAFWNLPDNFLSARAAQVNERAAKWKYAEMEKIDALWRDVLGEFERAVINGDAEWFERQRKAISQPANQPDRFEAAVVCWLRQVVWSYRARQGATRESKRRPQLRIAKRRGAERREAAQLTLPGKTTDWTAADIYQHLEVEKLPRGELRVEGRLFKPRPGKTSKNAARERVLDAIAIVAKRYDVTLRKEQGKRRSTDSQSGAVR